MTLVPNYIAFDLETTGLDSADDEIIEIAMVSFVGGVPHDTWSTLVNPGRPVPLKVARLTGIDPNALHTSPKFPEIASQIRSFRRDLPLVGHNSDFDVAFLAKLIPDFPDVPVYDTLELARIVMPGFRSYKLSDLADALGIPLEDAHRAYDDARVSGQLFALIQERIASMPHSVRANVVSVMGPNWAPRAMFALPEDARPVLPLFPPPKPTSSGKGAPGVYGERFTEVLDSPPVPVRLVDVSPEQEASRGIAVAARGHAIASGFRYLLVGFPLGQMSGVARPAPDSRDYLCAYKMAALTKIAPWDAVSSLDIEERRFLAGLFVWETLTETGWLGDLQIAGKSVDTVKELRCPSDMGCREECPLRDICHALAAERAARAPGAYFTGLGSAFGMKDRYDGVIVWTAQDMQREWQYREPRIDLGSIPASGPLFRELQKCAANDVSRGQASPGTLDATRGASEELGSLADELLGTLREDLAGEWAIPPIVGREFLSLRAASSDLAQFASEGGDSLALVESGWSEREKGPILIRRAMWPAERAVQTMVSSLGPVILVSDVASDAASTPGGRRLLGVDESVPVSSLWSRESEASRLLLVSVDTRVAPSGPQHALHVASTVRALAGVVKKGLLVLFPSRAALRDTYYTLAQEFEELGLALWGQTVDGGRKVLEHLGQEDAVVFALFTAASSDDYPAPGCVVITKVPFLPPNPLTDARQKALSVEGDGFVEASVRPVALAARSYASRMLAPGDPGAMVFADPRLLPGRSRWSAGFFRSFGDLSPKCLPLSRVADQVLRHLD